MAPIWLLGLGLGTATLLWLASQSVGIADVSSLEHALDETALDRVSFGATGTSEAAFQTFLRMNPSDVPDHLLLGVILSGSTRRSPVDVARELLERSGHDISRVDAPMYFQETEGVGDAGRARVLASTELARRIAYRKAMLRRRPVTSPEAAYDVLQTMSTGPYETFSAIYLDRRRRVIGTRVLTVGSDAFTIVDPRMVFRPAIELGASAVIVSHQHPSGDPNPSSQDIDVTQRVVAAGDMLGIPLLDHIIVGSPALGFTSLAQRNQIPMSSQRSILAYDE